MTERRSDPARWLVLGCYMLVAAVTQLMWLTYAPIASATQRLMGVSEFRVVVLGTLFPLGLLMASIPAGLIIDRKGFRFAVLIGAAATAGFSFLRLFPASYPVVLIGTLGAALAQPFVINSIMKLVSTWFPSEESALATGLGALALFLGMIAALVAGPALLDTFGADRLGSLRDIALLYAVVATGALALFAVAGKARPAVPPRRAEREGETAVVNLRSLRTILRLHDYRLLCIGAFIGSGSFVGLIQLLEKIMQPKGISANGAGNIGAAMIVAGVVGCVVIPRISDRTMRRKPFLLFATAAAAVAIAAIAGLRSPGQLTVVGIGLGFFVFSAYPIMLAMAEETTGARLTGLGTSVMTMVADLGGVLITFAMIAIKEAVGGPSGSFFWSLMIVSAAFLVALAVAARLHEGTRGPGAALPSGDDRFVLAEEPIP